MRSTPIIYMNQCKNFGFSLIELMIVVVIGGILAGLAYPSFTHSLYKARRTDGIEALLSLQQAQERWRSNNTQYATLSLLGLPTSSTKGYYTLSLADNPSATGYSAIATATQGSSQFNDHPCQTLRVDVNPANNPGQTLYSPSVCWSQ
jgi:type IV pilus assembly protein PilE